MDDVYMRECAESLTSTSSPPVLCPVVHYVKNKCKVGRLIEKDLKVLDRLFLTQVESEFVQKVLMYVTMLDVRDVGVDHKRDKVEDEVG